MGTGKLAGFAAWVWQVQVQCQICQPVPTLYLSQVTHRFQPQHGNLVFPHMSVLNPIYTLMLFLPCMPSWSLVLSCSHTISLMCFLTLAWPWPSLSLALSPSLALALAVSLAHHLTHALSHMHAVLHTCHLTHAPSHMHGLSHVCHLPLPHPHLCHPPHAVLFMSPCSCATSYTCTLPLTWSCTCAIALMLPLTCKGYHFILYYVVTT